MGKETTFEQSVAGLGTTRTTRTFAGGDDCRVYVTEEGDCYPSVTEITDRRSNPRKRHALRWFRRKHDGTGGTEHHSDISTVKMHFGTLAHYYVLQPLTDRDLWGESEATAKRGLQNHGQFRGLDAWEWARKRFEFVQRKVYQVLIQDEITDILGVEQYVIDENIGYAGQYDLVYTRQVSTGDETVICDLKTGKNVYPDHELQIAAYANAVNIDVDRLKIIRAHPTDGTGNGELQVFTDRDFDSSWETRTEEFIGYTQQFHKQITSVDTASKQEPETTGETVYTTSQTSPKEDETEQEGENNVVDPIAEFVKTHTGSPIAMKDSLRSDVDNGDVPPMARQKLEHSTETEFDDEYLLQRLDELLPPSSTPTSASAADSTSIDNSDSQRTKQSQPGSRSKDSAPNLDSTHESRSSTGEPTTVEVSPAIVMLLDRAAASDDRFADTRHTVVDNALNSFLASTVGAELDPTQFKRTNTHGLSIDCGPVLSRVLELTSASDERFDETGDVVTTAVSKFLGLGEESTSVQINSFGQYQMIVDTLVENGNCPCETVDEVVELALEAHLLR